MKNNRKQSNGWLLKITAIVAFCFLQLAINSSSFAQCQPYIKIDGNKVLANQTIAAGLALPYWLKANQTLAVDQMVNSISVIEFTINATSGDLDFSQVLSVTTLQTVPSGKVWKIESLSKQPTLSSSNGAVFSGPGTYTLIVPTCASYICIEAWGSGGGGGGGGSGNSGKGGGGGGGGYGQGCYTVTPGQSLSITIGNSGTNGSSGSINGGNASGPTTVTGTGVNMSVEGGYGGLGANNGGTGGAGGTVITAIMAVAGSNGSSYGAGGPAGGSPSSIGGAGGIAGSSTGSVVSAVIPGGGGGGQYYSSSYYSGGASAPGQVKITW